jgi:hypothetical protein
MATLGVGHVVLAALLLFGLLSWIILLGGLAASTVRVEGTTSAAACPYSLCVVVLPRRTDVQTCTSLSMRSRSSVDFLMLGAQTQ